MVLVSKTTAVVLIGVVYGVVSVASSGGFGALVLVIKGERTYLDDAQVWRTFVMILLVFVLWALLGFGFGMLIRNQLAAVFIALGIALIAQISLAVLFSALHWDTPPKLLPNSLSQGMLVTSDPTNGAGGTESVLRLVGVRADLRRLLDRARGHRRPGCSRGATSR